MLRVSRAKFFSSSIFKRSSQSASFSTTKVSTTSAVTTTPFLLNNIRHLQEVNSSATTSYWDQNASRRDQESFLAQYSPMEVLGLHEGETSLKKISSAYESKKKEYRGNKHQTEQVERAFQVITDPASPYFERQNWQQMHRQSLLVELLPNNQKIWVKLYAGFWWVILGSGSIGIVYMFFLPIFRIWRVATR